MFGFPVWATVSANGMEKLQVPDEVTELHIFGDNDQSMTGQAVAYSLAAQSKTVRRRVEVHLPERTGDWNDVLLEEARCRKRDEEHAK